VIFDILSAFRLGVKFLNNSQKENVFEVKLVGILGYRTSSPFFVSVNLR